MKVLLTGGNGQLGKSIIKAKPNNIILISPNKTELDLENEERIIQIIESESPDWIINSGAYTNVDRAEIEKEKAYRVNCKAPKILSKAISESNIKLLQISTDYVFDGTLDRPYKENDSCHPINKYGQSKWIGEDKIQKYGSQFYIFRVQWLYGQHGHHFIKSIFNAVESGKPLTIVSDQWGSPSWTRDIARCVVGFLAHDPAYGIYHLTNSGYTTWYDFANYFLHYLDINVAVKQQTTFEFDRPAKRPLNGRLDTRRFLSMSSVQPLSWRDAVTEFLDSSFC